MKYKVVIWNFVIEIWRFRKDNRICFKCGVKWLLVLLISLFYFLTVICIILKERIFGVGKRGIEYVYRY